MTITQASRKIFQTYLIKLDNLFIEDNSPQLTNQIHQLRMMCQTVINNTSMYDNITPKMTEDKVSRWLGYVQGMMTANGWITVAEERENTRPLFHKAYADSLMKKPESITAKLDDIVFHIIDMNDFNARCVKKFKVRTYKELPKEKLLKIGFKIMKKSKPLVYKTLKKLNYTFTFNTTEDKDMYSFIFVNPRLK